MNETEVDKVGHLDEKSRLVDRVVFSPPEVPYLKIRIYSEDSPISQSMWERAVVSGLSGDPADFGDSLKALRGEDGKIWLALRARRHADIVLGLNTIGIKIVDSEETRFQISINGAGKVKEISVPWYIGAETIKGAEKILKMIPKSMQEKGVRLNSSSAHMIIGSDVMTFRRVLGSQLEVLKKDKHFIRDYQVNGITYVDMKMSDDEENDVE